MLTNKKPCSRKLFRLSLALTVLCIVFASYASAQIIHTKKAVRRHQVNDEQTALIAKAATAIEKQDYATAEKVLKEAAISNPKNDRAWFGLGYVYQATDRTAEAKDAYLKAVGIAPGAFDVNLNLGLLLANQNDPEAEKYLRTAIQAEAGKHQAQRAEAWLGLGVLLAPKDAAQAAEAFSEALKLEPRNAEARLYLARTLERSGQLPEAEAEYRRLLELNPKSQPGVAGLLGIYTKTNRTAEAQSMLRKLVAGDPENAAARAQLGRVLADDKKYDEAKVELQAAAKLAPQDATIKRDLARLALESRQFAEAEAQYRDLLSALPSDAALYRDLGTVLMQQKKFAEAEVAFLKAVQLKPDFVAAYGDLAFAASSNKNYVLTLQALAERAKYEPDVPGTYFLRATAFDHLRDPKQAAENYRKFLEVANGKFPDQEWQARHRLKAIEPKKK